MERETVTKTVRRKFNRCDSSAVWTGLQRWYRSALGQELAHIEKNNIKQVLSDLFGYHLVQLGRLTEDNWLESSRISHCRLMEFQPQSGSNFSQCAGLYGSPEALPLQTDSIDVMVLLHTLEFSHSPHQILREVERVLIPEGHVVLLVFNNWSLWNVWRWILGWRGHPPWCGRFLSTTRLRDWLALLGFDVMSIRGGFYRAPVQHPGILKKSTLVEGLGRRLWPILGASNLIVARKRVTTLTAIGPKWELQRKQVVSAGLAEPFQGLGRFNLRRKKRPFRKRRLRRA